MAYIKGIFIQDIYKNDNNGYMVGLMRVSDSSDKSCINSVITFTGMFIDLKVKTTYNFDGEFTTHPRYGNQFVVNSYELVLPTDEEELIDFLSSDLFPIGEKTAERIVSKLGKNAIDIIIKDPDCLLDIPKLGKARIEKIINVLDNYQNTSKIVLELSKMGFSTKNAITLMKKLNNKILDIVNNNIYDVRDFVDITFNDIDSIAIKNGYSLNDERRLEALTIHLMNAITFDSGDTYSFFDEIYDVVKKKTDDLSSGDFEYILMKLHKKGRIKKENDRYYLSELYDAEHFIVDRVCLLNNMKRRKLPGLTKKIGVLEDENNITYDESQKDAISRAINNNLTIITGGPGTGKTTIVKCIVKLLLDIYKIDSSKIAMLAPTGRAARKLMETTGITASTIHRFLKWDKESNTFQINEMNPNNHEYIIVDESSMIDTVLMASLFRGTTLNAKFIFVGDYYQLPSVSQGQVLKDLIDSECLDVIKLNRLYRQTDGSYIINLAHEIKNKDLSEEFLSKKDDYNFISCSQDEVVSVVREIVIKAVEKGYNKDNIQVLAPLYKTSAGIDSLNNMLKELLNEKEPSKNEYISGDIVYREGDKVLQLVNDYDNNISNGDIGYIESISTNRKTKKTEILINYDGVMVTYSPTELNNITHGYAISVHKSQGGEFKMVVIPFVPSFKRMLYNKLVYTAVTRAKEKLILVGEPNSFIYGIKNDYVENRKTSIKELIIGRYN